MGKKKGSRRLQRPSTAASDEPDYTKNASADLDDLGMDDEDAFHSQTGKISLNSEEVAGHRRRQQMNETADQEVFGLDVSDSDDDDVSGDEDEALLQRLQQDLRKGGDSDEDDDEGDDLQDDEEEDERAWGNNRKMYYNADDASDDDDAKEEEKEVIRLQKLRASQLNEEDFVDDTADTFVKRHTFGEEAIDDEQNDLDHLAISSELPFHLLRTETAAEVENITRAKSNLSTSDLIKIAETQMPEVVHLLEDFSLRWSELTTVVGPALKWHCRPANESKPNSRTDRARQYLELKYRIFTTYLTNISFYLSLRANPPPGTNIKSHPVVDSLAQLQELINVLEKRVEGAESSDEESDHSDEEKSAKKRKSKKRKVQKIQGMPHLMECVVDMMADEMAEDPDAFSDDDEERSAFSEDEEMVVEPKPASHTKVKKAKKIKETAVPIIRNIKEADSMIPDIEFVPFGKVKKSKSARAKAVKGLSNDFGESSTMDDMDIQDKLSRKRSLKFHVTRVDQAIASRNARIARSGGGDDDIPYRDREGKLMFPTTREPTPKAVKEKPKKSNDPEVGGKILDDGSSGLDFEAIAEALAKEDAEDRRKNKGKRARDEYEDDAGSDQDYDDDAMEYYNSIKDIKKAKSDQHDQRGQEIRDEKFQAMQADRELYNENDLTEGSKRAATWRILANKGLTPRRKKENRNPRVKRRLKYEKAQKKLGSFKRMPVDKATLGAYQGEKTGIKSNLSRSTIFSS
ncbi:hypothetical protein DFS34DRAFT_616227 [Phlyctochytrium arcticum]|nr:hypothetical protein DFS34DRAFT_616227 [Phlyctochytrium arcticum]